MSTTKLLDNLLDNYVGWEAAIADATTQALEAEKTATRMRATAAVLKKKMESGEPWPGSENAATHN